MCATVSRAANATPTCDHDRLTSADSDGRLGPNRHTRLPRGGLPPGVKALALWRGQRVGAVLFFAEANSGLFPFAYRPSFIFAGSAVGLDAGPLSPEEASGSIPIWTLTARLLSASAKATTVILASQLGERTPRSRPYASSTTSVLGPARSASIASSSSAQLRAIHRPWRSPSTRTETRCPERRSVSRETGDARWFFYTSGASRGFRLDRPAAGWSGRRIRT
jgi:hypothetical protein